MSGKPKFVSNETRERMLELRTSGETLQSISDQVGIPRERVRQILICQDAPRKVPISLDLMDYSYLDPVWVAEFRGFFMGEGCASIIAGRRYRSRPQYQPRLSIALREDDADVILDIHKHLGGNVIRCKRETRANYPNTKPACQWQLVGFSKLTNLLPLLLSGPLPSKKREDIEIIYKMCLTRLAMPYNITQEQSLELSRFYEACKFAKHFQGSEG